MSYSDLRNRARFAPRYPRALVQVGGCSRALGADAVAAALQREAAKRKVNVPIITVGCDGACFEAPVVVIEAGEARTFRLAGAREENVKALVDEWLASAPSPDKTWRGSPARWSPDKHDTGFWPGQTRLVLENVGRIDPSSLDDYVALGGYSALNSVLSSLSPHQVIEQVTKEDLRGRGGAYFPAALKWKGARATPDRIGARYLIVNAEEGEPGIYKDRHIMEGDPFKLLEGIAIAAYAIGAEKVYLYINGEAHLSAHRISQALDQARARGLVGQGVLGSDFAFDIEIRRGGGGYVLGEESALMNSIEGQRNVPRPRPPFPVESGLWGRPTVINNVETLSNLPLIFAEKGSRFSQVGSDASRGTKLISLSGRVQRPGLVEVPMGTTIRRIVNDIGGGPLDGHEIWGVVAGGPSGGLLPASLFDTPIGPGMLDPAGAVLGSGGVTVLDDTLSPLEVVRRLAAYNAAESCSKCTPCREGTRRMLDILDALAQGKGKASDLEYLSYLCDIVGYGSLCGLGQMAPGPVRSGLAHFRGAFEEGDGG